MSQNQKNDNSAKGAAFQTVGHRLLPADASLLPFLFGIGANPGPHTKLVIVMAGG